MGTRDRPRPWHERGDGADGRGGHGTGGPAQGSAVVPVTTVSAARCPPRAAGKKKRGSPGIPESPAWRVARRQFVFAASVFGLCTASTLRAMITSSPSRTPP